MLRTEIRDDPAVFAELASWWNQQTGPEQVIVLRSEWFLAMAQAILEPTQGLRVWVIRDGDDPVAALPLFQTGTRLRSLTELSTEAFDVVGASEQRIIDHLVSGLSRRTYVRLEALLGDSPLVAALESLPRWRVDHRTQLAYIPVAERAEDVLAGLSKKLRSNLRRGQRALESLGKVRAVAHPAPEDVESVLAEGLALEAAGWKGQAGLAVRDSDKRLRFFMDLASVAEKNGWLRLSAMYLDERMIAFNYDLEYRGQMTGLLTTYEEELDRRCSPGHVLVLRVLEEAAKRGVQSYELGGIGGRNAWKLVWTNATSPRAYMIGFGSNPQGQLAHAAWRSRTAYRRMRGAPSP